MLPVLKTYSLEMFIVTVCIELKFTISCDAIIIWGFDSSHYEEYYLLQCNTM
jgi:hypothetical protein